MKRKGNKTIPCINSSFLMRMIHKKVKKIIMSWEKLKTLLENSKKPKSKIKYKGLYKSWLRTLKENSSQKLTPTTLNLNPIITSLIKILTNKKIKNIYQVNSNKSITLNLWIKIMLYQVSRKQFVLWRKSFLPPKRQLMSILNHTYLSKVYQ